MLRAYSDPCGGEILAGTGDTPHNTITPIARKKLVRITNWIGAAQQPYDGAVSAGIFHPHLKSTISKKENIGLIEVMGLAVLDGTPEPELRQLARALADGARLTVRCLKSHAAWAEPMRQTCRGRTEAEIWQTLLLETGRVFVGVLEDAGVYKQTPAGKAGLGALFKKRCRPSARKKCVFNR